MKHLYPLRGIVTVLNTPFTYSGSIDTDGLRKHVQMALNAGVNGFLVPAMASEVQKLTLMEKLQIVELVVAEVDNRVSVFAGLGGTDYENMQLLLREYMKLGCKEVLFQLPFRNESQFKSQFKKLADIGPEVVMLQDWDSTGYGLPDTLILELFHECDSFRCLKIETIPAGIKYSRLLDLTQGKLHVSGGWAVIQMIEGLRRGVHAFMPTGMHYIYTQIYRDYEAGKIEKAMSLFESILPVLSFSNQHLDISIHFFKRLLYQQKIYSTNYVRQPSIPFDVVHEEISDQLIQQINQIESEIKQTRLQCTN